MIRQRVYYSFDQEADGWRAATVWNMGVVEGGNSVHRERWDDVSARPGSMVQARIREELAQGSCTVVLVGAETAESRLVGYEIRESWESVKGVVGVRIHGLRDRNGRVAARGANPFRLPADRHENLSGVVKCYDPPGRTSQERYEWIRRNLARVVEEAVRIRMADLAEEIGEALGRSARLTQHIENLFQVLDFPAQHATHLKRIHAYGTCSVDQSEELLIVAQHADTTTLRRPEVRQGWAGVIKMIRNSMRHGADRQRMTVVVEALEKILSDSGL